MIACDVASLVPAGLHGRGLLLSRQPPPCGAREHRMLTFGGRHFENRTSAEGQSAGGGGVLRWKRKVGESNKKSERKKKERNNFGPDLTPPRSLQKKKKSLHLLSARGESRAPWSQTLGLRGCSGQKLCIGLTGGRERRAGFGSQGEGTGSSQREFSWPSQAPTPTASILLRRAFYSGVSMRFHPRE